MNLEQIKLSGFKSFVDNVSLQIYGKLVAVVGPNGCGKSNVIDAVRWVLGEASAKQLRGESMQDVIFNGSSKRKQVSRATVELIFNNQRKTLTGLWNSYEEISIKRLITRSGESVYYINNQVVRRKDITELFLGTGVGSKGYAVIEQGMISKIIESKPEELRQYLEEVSGVSKYREKRKETLQRLTDTKDNLVRLQDIYDNLLKQLNLLQQQAEVAQYHQLLTKQFKHNEILILLIKINEANKILNEAKKFIVNCESELQVLSYQLDEINDELITQQELKTEKETSVQALVNEFNQSRTNLARFEERYKLYSELIKRFEQETALLNAQQLELTKQIEDLNFQEESYEQEICAKQIIFEDKQLLHDEQLTKVNYANNEYQVLNEKFASRNNRLNHYKHELALLNNDLSHKQNNYDILCHKIIVLQQEIEQNKQGEQTHLLLQQEISLLETQLEKSSVDLQNTAELNKLTFEQTELFKQQQQINEEKVACSAIIDTLTDLLANASQANSQSAEIKQLWQYLQVDSGYKIAIQAILGDLLRAQVITIDEKLDFNDNGKKIYWKLSSSHFQPLKGSISNNVKITHPQLTNLYSFLNNYIVVDNLLTEASGFAKKVTLEGHIVNEHYIILNADSSSILEYQQQLTDKQTKLINLNKLFIEFETKLVNVNNKISQLTIILESNKAQHKEFTTKKYMLQLEFSKQQQIALQQIQRYEKVTQEVRLLNQESQQLVEQINMLKIALEDKQFAIENLLIEQQEKELINLEHETQLSLLKNQLQDTNMQINQLAIDIRLYKQHQINCQNLIKEKILQQQLVKQKLINLVNEQGKLNNDNQAQEITTLQQTINNLANVMNTEQAIVENLSKAIISLKNKANLLNNNYQTNLENINQAKFKQQKQEVLLVTFDEQLAKLQISEINVKQLLNENVLDLDALNKLNLELILQIEELGLVNLKAIEDLVNSQEQSQELLNQINDLNQALATLEGAISQIDEVTKKLLQATFDKVNLAIQVYFKTLFGGGNAEISLTENNILNAGIQIFAEPPGKKNTTIHLLSGGEKALTAMSFIFALFSLNPAPFCLLDEVDAPLDDANTQRFCNLVKELSANTQFIYISHNRLAMEMADQLIGVTMQEKGISTIVSVNLVEAVSNR